MFILKQKPKKVWAWKNCYFRQFAKVLSFVLVFQLVFSTSFIPEAQGAPASYKVTDDGLLWSTGEATGGNFSSGTTLNTEVIGTDLMAALKLELSNATGIKAVYAYDQSVYVIKGDNTLWVAGANWNGELGIGSAETRVTTFQYALSDVASLTSNGGSIFALKTDDTLWATGVNWYGQLGNGTMENILTFTQVLSGVQSVYIKTYSTFAIKTDGTLWATGYNEYGQLGDETINNRTNFVQVLSNIQSLELGYYTTFALATDGRLYGAGYNGSGLLGNGTTNNQIGFQSLMLNVQAVSYDDNYSTLVLKTDGTVWAAGNNSFGQLGDGTNTNRNTFIQVSSGVQKVKAEGSSSYLLKTDNTLWATGSGDYGQLGDWNFGNRNSFIQVLTGVSSFEYKNQAIFAIKTDGTLWTTGANWHGQLGNGTSENNINTFQNVLSGVQTVRPFGIVTFAIKTDDTLWATGYNGANQLGDGTMTNRNTFGQIATDVIDLSGNDSTFILKNDGSILVTGRDNWQLGQGNEFSVKTFQEIKRVGTDATVLASDDNTYVLESDGILWAAGDNYRGQIGDGTNLNAIYLKPVLNNVKNVFTGEERVFALKNDNTLWAAGENVLGDGTNDNSNTFVQVLSDVKRVIAGRNDTFVIKNDDTLWVAGNNYDGALGVGDTSNRTSFEQLMTDVADVAIYQQHSAILKIDGTVWTAGSNWDGQLGNGNNDSSYSFVEVMSGATAVATGNSHTMVLKADGTLWTTGGNGSGQLGDGTWESRNTFTQVLSWVQSIFSTKGNFTFALKTDNTLWSTGANWNGQLGDGTSENRNTFTQVLSDVKKAEARSSGSVFALKNDDTLWATGWNYNGLLGLGDLNSRNTFTQVMSEVKDVSNYDDHSVILTKEGVLMGAGDSDDGQYGNGYSDRIYTFTNIPSLGTYPTSGTFTSAVIDLGSTNVTELGNFSYLAETTTGTSLTMDLRAGNTASPDGTWTAWQTGISNGADVSGLGAYRYVQYRANLATTNIYVTPIVKKVSLTYTIDDAVSGPQVVALDNYNDNGLINTKTPALQFDLDHSGSVSTKYQIQVDNDADFSSPVISFTELNFASVPRNNLTFTTSVLADGRYYWRVKAIDSNSSESAWSTATNGFRIDTTLPSSTILYPQTETSLKQVSKIVVSATDNTAVDYVRISIKDTSTGLYYNGTAFSANTETWLMTTNVNGRYEYTAPTWTDQTSYTIRSRAMDTAGNEEHTDSITFTYDTINGLDGSIYVSEPSVMNNSDYKLYYPNFPSLNTNGYITIDFDNSFKFSPWLEDADVVMTDAGGNLTGTSDSFDRLNKIITTTITGGSVSASDLLTIEINNLRIHNPDNIGTYPVLIKLFNEFEIEVDSGTGEIVISRAKQQVQLNANVEQALQIGVDSGSVALEVDPDVQLGQNWTGTGGAVAHKTEVEVKTNAVNGYNLLIKLAGNTATGSALLDGTTNTGNQIASTSGDRLTSENNFSFGLDTGTASSVTAFTNSSTAVSGAGLSSPTNSNKDNIFYYLNVDYTTPADVYKGTVTYTAVGQF